MINRDGASQHGHYIWDVDESVGSTRHPYQETILHRGENWYSIWSHKPDSGNSISPTTRNKKKIKGSLAELVYCTGLENQRAVTALRGFESLSFRHNKQIKLELLNIRRMI